MITELTTYPERDKLLDENDVITETFESENQFDIWNCKLLKNKQTGKYSIFLTADSDEQWAVLDFEENKITL